MGTLDASLKAHSLGEVAQRLAQAGEIQPDQLALAQAVARRQQLTLDVVLHDMGLVSARRFCRAIAEATGCALYEPFTRAVDPAVAGRLSRSDAERIVALPIADDGRQVTVVMADVFDPLLQERLRSLFPGRRVAPLVASRAETFDLINLVHSRPPDYTALEATLDGIADVTVAPSGEPAAARPPVIRLCDALLEHAVITGASDIHLDPTEHVLVVRFRIDGQMRYMHSFRRAQWAALLHRFKILAQMDIGRHLDTQSGQFSRQMQGRRINFRAALMPALHGEHLVIRVMDQKRGGLRLEDIGLGEASLRALRALTREPGGLILVGGPIASGKTTTATALLGELGGPGRCIVTIEDPVEVEVASARQIPVRKGFGFGEAMREVLRQDADVVFLGEVRDPDAAQLTVSTAMIGKRMLATVHASDAATTLWRLQSLGVDASSLAQSLLAITNQRLVPRLCPSCRRPGPTAAGWVAAGCRSCSGTGVLGRVPVMEVLRITPTARALLAAGRIGEAVHALRTVEGERRLREDALERIASGECSRDDVAALVDLGPG